MLGAIKGCFKDQSLTFICTLCVGIIILARSNQTCPSVATTSQGDFWSHGAKKF
jgi:hypothetical protein